MPPVRGLGRGPSSHGGVEQGRKRHLRDRRGQKDTPATSHLQPGLHFIKCKVPGLCVPGCQAWTTGPAGLPQSPDQQGWVSGHQPPSLSKQGLGPYLPAHTWELTQVARGHQPLQGRPPRPQPLFPLEGGQARGRAGQATPVPGKHSLASSGPAGTKTPAQGSRPTNRPLLCRSEARAVTLNGEPPVPRLSNKASKSCVGGTKGSALGVPPARPSTLFLLS